jgi:UDP-N-acetylglucosamine--N-acetylmuramyl-(pentapeptide) pyrophosphoryl-undecaprenol N-acetylglucosamine transferase
MDAQLVQPSGIPFYGIFAGKLRRYFSWWNFVDPFLVIIGFFQSLVILIRFWPQAIFSKGGYVSLPVVFAAFILRRPIILHESDSRMGIANRIASRMSKKVCVAFPDLQKQSDKFILTGNPIREEILDGSSETGYELTGFHPGHPVVLVWGGSQGAQEINDMVSWNFNRLKLHFQIIHITGKGKKIGIKDPAYCSFEYLGEDLKHIYAITDFIVGRAGANSLYEIALIQKPNIVIPLENADQQMNAEYFEKNGATIILREGHDLYDLLIALYNNPEKQESMKESLMSIARPNAAEEIADLILK